MKAINLVAYVKDVSVSGNKNLAASFDCGCDHRPIIGIPDDVHRSVNFCAPHDTSRNTSSSVRKPRDSANGMAILRCFSNARIDNWRRKAPRTISDLDWPVISETESSRF